MSSGSEEAVYWQPMEFHIGRTLRRTFDVFTRNALAYCLACAVVQLPRLYFDFALTQRALQILPFTYVYLFYSSIAGALCTALIVFAAFQDLRGRPVDMPESISRGLRRLVPVLLTSLCVGIGVFLGLIVFTIPGIIFLLMTYCALPVCVVEGEGPFSSITRSAQLTKNHRWGLFGVTAIIFMANLILGFAIARLTFPYAYNAMIHALLDYFQSVAVSAFTAVMSVIIYNDLRVAREGIDVEEIAAVFD
jgi:hypothetical protein